MDPLPLTVSMAGDNWNGPPIASVQIDNGPAQLFTVTAQNYRGQVDPVVVAGGGGDPTVPHVLTITFTNDAYGGTPATDRNLYVRGVRLGTAFIPCVANLMSTGSKVTVALPVMEATPAAPQPTLSITNWGNLKTSSLGDASSWSNSIPPGENRTLNGSDEAEWYSDCTVPGAYDPFSVDTSGNLVITAIPCTPDPAKGNKTYLSGALASNGFFNQQYGSFRFMAKLAPGNGLRPAIWLLPSNMVYSGEADVGEWWQGDISHVHQTVHGMINGAWQTPNVSPTVTPDIDDALHEYRMDWNATNMTFFVDGVQTGQFPTPDGLKCPCFIIINLGIGSPGSWCGTPVPGQALTMTVGAVTVYPAS